MSRSGTVRRLTVFSAMVLGALIVIACSSSSPTAGPANGGDADQFGPVRPAPATGAPAANPGDASTAVDPGQLIVRTGTLDVEVQDVDAAATRGRDLVSGIGGYVSGSNETTKDEQRQATITYRIPVDRWQEAITALRAIGTRVIAEDTKADEVTSQVVDLNARIDNARASEASYRAILARAGTIDDVLSVQAKLDSVQEDIERMVAQQQDLTGRAAMGTLAVTWETPAVAAVAEVQSGWNLGHEVDNALSQTVKAGQGLASFLIWLVLVGVPVFGPFIVIGLVIVWFVRRYQRLHPRPVHPGWGSVQGGSMAMAPQAWYPTAPAPGPEPSAPAGPEAEEDEEHPG